LEALPSAADLWDHSTDRVVRRFVQADEPVPELDDKSWLLLEAAVCREAVKQADGVWVVNPQSGNGNRLVYSDTAGYTRWCRSPCYYAGSHPMEVRLLAESLRLKRIHDQVHTVER
jgi:hypothetical protein